MVHRDIKLDNILVHKKSPHSQGNCISDFVFKLGDMGLAKEFDNSNLTTTFAGTPLAMAPEIIHGRSYGLKADVWSLGTLLFQILTGTHPFTGRNMKELEKNIKNGGYMIPKGIEISLNCIDFLNSCLRF